MVRRTVLTIGILCGASVAAVLAVASEMSRAGSHLVERTVGRGPGSSAKTASGASDRGDNRLAHAPDEGSRGEYCRFPESRGAEAATAVPPDARGNSVDSMPLVTEGQSRVPDALPQAQCVGDTVGTPLILPSKR